MSEPWVAVAVLLLAMVGFDALRKFWDNLVGLIKQGISWSAKKVSR